MKRYNTITEIKEANQKAGYYFFEKGTLRFFNSRIEARVYGGRYFITSEQFIPSSGKAEPRRYTINEAGPDGDIDMIGEFQEHATLRIARAHTQHLAKVNKGA